jgi:thiol:disulfide interchange protein DsbC
MLLFSGLAVAADRAEIEQVRQGVGKLLGGETPDSIQPSVVQGVYEVMIGPRLVYVSADGKYLLNGKLFDIETREDLTTPKVAKAKARAIEAVGEENMVIFAPEKFEHTVTVFTDIDCGYCRKLHSEIGQYNDLGIRVRYMMFPRAGVGSSSFDKAVAVWCADDRQKAMTLSKAGKQVEQKKCENPIIQHMELGQQLGVTGTPAIFFDDGELLPGYVPAKRMLSYLKAKQSQ